MVSVNSFGYCIRRSWEKVMEPYFGTYQTFRAASKEAAARLIGPDALIGDQCSIECTLEDGVHKAWLVNSYHDRLGYFDADFSRELSLFKAQGMKLAGFISFIAFTDNPEPGYYWGEAAVLCWEPVLAETMDTFIPQLSRALKHGTRPRINLDANGIRHLEESKGSWMPKDTVPLPRKEKGTALLKSHQSLTDSLVEKGRQGNKGCYILSWAFLLLLVTLVIVGMKSCGVF